MLRLFVKKKAPDTLDMLKKHVLVQPKKFALQRYGEIRVELK